MMYSAEDVAEYLIWRANEDADFGENISNLKLQKLLYYAQGFHLVLAGGPLFSEPIKAWKHGPVVECVYHKYKHHGASAIPTPADYDPGRIDPETQSLIEDVYGVYGQYSAWGLRNLTHQEPPWQNTPDSHTISHEALSRFFSTQVECV